MTKTSLHQLEQTFTLDELWSVPMLNNTHGGKKKQNRKYTLYPSFFRSERDQQIYTVNWLHKKTGNSNLIKTREAKLICHRWLSSLPHSVLFKVLLQQICTKPCAVLGFLTCSSEWCFWRTSMAREGSERMHLEHWGHSNWRTGLKAEWQWGWRMGLMVR